MKVISDEVGRPFVGILIGVFMLQGWKGVESPWKQMTHLGREGVEVRLAHTEIAGLPHAVRLDVSFLVGSNHDAGADLIVWEQD